MDDQNPPNIGNCGIYTGPGGSVTANKIVNIINPPPARTEVAVPTKSPFRFNIPTPTKHFKGRTKILEAVRDFFSNLPLQTDDCWERIVAIVGLGGMGKTETAYKFAAEFEQTFQSVAWINAETEKSTLVSFLGLAKYLKLVPHDHKEADLELVRQVYRHIDEQDYGCTLFIFDNAIRLHADPSEDEFGIYECLPIDGLKWKRFPNVLITTQTQDWERGIETIQVDELSAEESLEFFRGTFRIQSAECDDLFRKLYELFEGYPLVMNLAASRIDYNPKRDSVDHLKEQIQSYIDKLNKEQSKLLNEKFNRAWPTKYYKTLSNVWKLTFERIQQEEKGSDALDILQYMSFYHNPISSIDVKMALIRLSDCPQPAEKEQDFQMKELLRVLERFYTVRILEEWEFGIHRLVQLVVRQQMDSTEDLDRILFHFASNCTAQNNRNLNQSALEEALHRSQLSQRALPYVGILACKGYASACKIFETTQPETKAAATIRRLYFLERGRTSLSENEIEILHELVGLTTSEERLQDRRFFIDTIICLLTDKGHLEHSCYCDCGTEVPGYFDLDNLDGVDELAAKFILNVYSVQDLICKCDSFECGFRKGGLWEMTVMLSKTFIREDAPSSILTTDVIADTWFALFDHIKYNDNGLWRNEVIYYDFWEKMYVVFHLQSASQSRIDMLRTCLWNRGLATILSQILDFVGDQCARGDEYPKPFLVALMDVCLGGMDLKEEPVQKCISSYCKIIATIESAYITKDFSDMGYVRFVVDSCSVWIKLFLFDRDPQSHKLLQSLSSLKFLDWIQRSIEDDSLRFRKFFRYNRMPEKYLSKYFPKFIDRFSSSDIKVIQTLGSVCRRLVEDVPPPIPLLGSMFY